MCQISSHVWASFLSTLLWSFAPFSPLLFTPQSFYPSLLPHIQLSIPPVTLSLVPHHIQPCRDRHVERERENERGLNGKNRKKPERPEWCKLILCSQIPRKTTRALSGLQSNHIWNIYFVCLFAFCDVGNAAFCISVSKTAQRIVNEKN